MASAWFLSLGIIFTGGISLTTFCFLLYYKISPTTFSSFLIYASAEILSMHWYLTVLWWWSDCCMWLFQFVCPINNMLFTLAFQVFIYSQLVTFWNFCMFWFPSQNVLVQNNISKPSQAEKPSPVKEKAPSPPKNTEENVSILCITINFHQDASCVLSSPPWLCILACFLISVSSSILCEKYINRPWLRMLCCSPDLPHSKQSLLFGG